MSPLDWSKVHLIDQVLSDHRLLWAETLAPGRCTCGWQTDVPHFALAREALHRRHVAEVVASLGGDA